MEQPIHSAEINEISQAVSNAQKEIKGAEKSSDNPFFKSKYASLESVWLASNEALTKNNLSVNQSITALGQSIFLVTTLAHKSGQWFKSYCPVYTKDNSPQALGSSLSYARRYSLAALVGVCPKDDDDAEAAMARPNPPPIANSTLAKNFIVQPKNTARGPAMATEQQINSLWPAAKRAGWTELDLATELERGYNVKNIASLTREQYSKLRSVIDTTPRPANFETEMNQPDIFL